MSGKTSWIAGLTGLSVALVMPGAVATAQQGADFYKGKTVNYIVATAPGGVTTPMAGWLQNSCRSICRAPPLS